MSIAAWREREDQVRPMLASTVEAPLAHRDFVYEPKYDGVRALARVAPGRPVPTVHLWSRAGNDKTAQFPAIVKALQRYALRLREPVLLDGEIVALDGRGEPVSFQHLQSRINRKSVGPADDAPSAFIAFDLLRDGPHDLRGLPLTARRAALERVFGDPGSPLLRLTPQVGQDGRDLYREAMARGWEGLIAKRASSRYLSGKRSPDWAKLKLQHAQEFVIGGWTEPRGSRAHFGALLLGVYDAKGRFTYVGHVGTGFTEAELSRLMTAFAPLQRKTSPFDVPPPVTNETPHWVKPHLVAQVRFTEWTDEGRLRHPAYLGLRDDIDPKAVRREPGGTLVKEAEARLEPPEPQPLRHEGAKARRASGTTQHAGTPARQHRTSGPRHTGTPALELVIDQLHQIEAGRKAKAALALPDGDSLEVSNLHKIFWPSEGLTKGDLMRYYVQVSPFILPVVTDRPLVMKRYPDGVRSEAFYQHRAPDYAVRTEAQTGNHTCGDGHHVLHRAPEFSADDIIVRVNAKIVKTQG